MGALPHENNKLLHRDFPHGIVATAITIQPKGRDSNNDHRPRIAYDYYECGKNIIIIFLLNKLNSKK